MNSRLDEVTRAAGGGYGPPPGGYGPPPGGYGAPGGGAYGPPPGGPPGGFVPPGGYPPPGMGGVNVDELQKRADKWMIFAILSIFCGCGLLGIINIIMASGAKTSIAQGNYADAESKLKTVKILCILGWVGVALAILFYIVYFVFVGVVLFAGAASG